MKKTLFIITISLYLLSCGEAKKDNQSQDTSVEQKKEQATTETTVTPKTETQPASENTNHSALGYLAKFNNQYPHDVKFLESEPLKTRLKALLKNDFALMQERLSTTVPIEVKSDVVFASGCMPHACTIDETAIAVDMKNDKIFVGILKDEKVQQYIETGAQQTPEAFVNWLKEKH